MSFISRINCGVVIAGLCAMASCFPSPVQAAEPEIESLALQSTVRICSEREENGKLVVGHGTAFGVDLSQFGYPGKRYLLSAGHNVLDASGHIRSTLKLELKTESGTHWSQCKVAAYDQDLDVCLVESREELPAILQLDSKEAMPGAPVVLAGSPRGVPVALFNGSVLRCFDRGTVRSSVQIPFDHGDSGGPVLSPRTGKVAGVAVAGVPKDGDMDHTVGLFLPLAAISSFLESNHQRNTSTENSIVVAEAVDVSNWQTSKPQVGAPVLKAVDTVQAIQTPPLPDVILADAIVKPAAQPVAPKATSRNASFQAATETAPAHKATEIVSAPAPAALTPTPVAMTPTPSAPITPAAPARTAGVKAVIGIYVSKPVTSATPQIQK